MKRHLRVKISMVVSAFCSLFLFYVYFLDGTALNKVYTGPNKRTYITTQKTYTTGEDVIVYSSDFCKLRNVPATITWFLVDDVKVAYPDKLTNFPATCYHNSKIEVGILPGFIGNTTYHFIGVLVYHLFARDITVNITTNDFYVSAKK